MRTAFLAAAAALALTAAVPALAASSGSHGHGQGQSTGASGQAGQSSQVVNPADSERACADMLADRSAYSAAQIRHCLSRQ